jgi:hypothetical protein
MYFAPCTFYIANVGKYMSAKSLRLLIYRFVSCKPWYELESVISLLSKTENRAQIEAGIDEKIEN